jgi:FkbM family methyltransferase
MVPGLQAYALKTRYGRIYCDLRYQACLPLLQRGEYFWWRRDEPGFASLPIERGDLVVDIGANIGIMSRIFASRGATVHAFEPSPSVLRLLRLNVEGLPVTIHDVAISDGNGVTSFCEIEGSSEQHIGDGIAVAMRTLDSFALSPKVIKIDVEGFEHRVLRGAAKTIKTYRPVILFEALCEAARQYCEDIILGIDSGYRFKTLPERVNHIAWPVSIE